MLFRSIEYAVNGTGNTQLFDLENDPHELNSLCDDPAYDSEIKRLRKELFKWKTELGDVQEHGQTFWKGFAPDPGQGQK